MTKLENVLIPLYFGVENLTKAFFLTTKSFQKNNQRLIDAARRLKENLSLAKSKKY